MFDTSKKKHSAYFDDTNMAKIRALMETHFSGNPPATFAAFVIYLMDQALNTPALDADLHKLLNEAEEKLKDSDATISTLSDRIQELEKAADKEVDNVDNGLQEENTALKVKLARAESALKKLFDDRKIAKSEKKSETAGTLPEESYHTTIDLL